MMGSCLSIFLHDFRSFIDKAACLSVSVAEDVRYIFFLFKDKDVKLDLLLTTRIKQSYDLAGVTLKIAVFFIVI